VELRGLGHPVEYQHGSEVFRTKISGLERTYGSIRRARGDGNCFFRR
jgi:ubiquitin thioesterase protein OTUB1